MSRLTPLADPNLQRRQLDAGATIRRIVEQQSAAFREQLAALPPDTPAKVVACYQAILDAMGYVAERVDVHVRDAVREGRRLTMDDVRGMVRRATDEAIRGVHAKLGVADPRSAT